MKSEEYKKLVAQLATQLYVGYLLAEVDDFSTLDAVDQAHAILAHAGVEVDE